MAAFERRRERPYTRLPFAQELIDSPLIERCQHCMIRWPSYLMVTDDDGKRLCPRGLSPTATRTYEAQRKEATANEAEDYVRLPNISLAPMVPTIPPTIMSITNAATGEPVYVGNPLSVARGGSGTLTLKGRNLSVSDTYSFPTNVSSIATVVDETEVSLAITVGLAATVGRHNITFNTDRTLRGVLYVR